MSTLVVKSQEKVTKTVLCEINNESGSFSMQIEDDIISLSIYNTGKQTHFSIYKNDSTDLFKAFEELANSLKLIKIE